MDALWTSAATFSELSAHLRDEAEELVGGLAKSLADRNLIVDTSVRHGRLRDVVLDEAHNWKADLIVVGVCAVRGVRRWLRGGVASYLVTHAPCSVEVVISPDR